LLSHSLTSSSVYVTPSCSFGSSQCNSRWLIQCNTGVT
jgi:hypothetical protein